MILVLCELKDKIIRKPSLEILSEARRLADTANLKVCALFIDTDCSGYELASQYGADIIVKVQVNNVDHYSIDSYAKIIANIMQEKQASVLLGAASSIGKDLIPRTAARLNAGYIADITNIQLINGIIECTRPIYAGKITAKVKFTSKIKTATSRSNIFEITKSQKTSIMETIHIQIENPLCKVVDFIVKKDNTIDITEANVILSVGRGLENGNNINILRELVEALPGSVIGASRAAVDAGWDLPHSIQIGQTGKVVSPNIYIACGISGAIQHVAGMNTSKIIIAINKNPDASIFKTATYGVIGDVLEIIPKITKALKITK